MSSELLAGESNLGSCGDYSLGHKPLISTIKLQSHSSISLYNVPPSIHIGWSKVSVYIKKAFAVYSISSVLVRNVFSSSYNCFCLLHWSFTAGHLLYCYAYIHGSCTWNCSYLYYCFAKKCVVLKLIYLSLSLYTGTSELTASIYSNHICGSNIFSSICSSSTASLWRWHLTDSYYTYPVNSTSSKSSWLDRIYIQAKQLSCKSLQCSSSANNRFSLWCSEVYNIIGNYVITRSFLMFSEVVNKYLFF